MSELGPDARHEGDSWRVVIGLIDAAIQGRVLVFGSLPPTARDLDLLARPQEETAIDAGLRAAAFAARGHTWVRFADCSALAVEVVPADAWSLPPRELADLFELARPLAASSKLVRPAPAHALLIAARRLGPRGDLREKLRGHVDTALAEQPDAWAEAARRAPLWNATDALQRLRALHGGSKTHSRLVLPRARRPRRTIVVAFSGLDGSGKSTQAAALGDTLSRLGIPAGVVWSPLGGNLVLAAIGFPAKALLRKLPVLRHTQLAAKSAGGSVMSSPGAAETGGGRGHRVKTGWATLVMFLNALSQRRAVVRRALRGGVVIFDRHALDSVVRARFLYGSAGGTRLQRFVARHVSPRARLAYFLDVPPETAFDRKPPDWSREELARQADLYRGEHSAFGARRIDGERARDDLCAEIAAEVWEAWT
jgi:thymidylate kinase